MTDHQLVTEYDEATDTLIGTCSCGQWEPHVAYGRHRWDREDGGGHELRGHWPLAVARAQHRLGVEHGQHALLADEPIIVTRPRQEAPLPPRRRWWRR